MRRRTGKDMTENGSSSSYMPWFLFLLIVTSCWFDRSFTIFIFTKKINFIPNQKIIQKLVEDLDDFII